MVHNPVLGAIVGDIVGSRYEFNNHKSKDFQFINDSCFFTDDTIHALAIYKAIVENTKYNSIQEAFIDNLLAFSKKYPNATYGARFVDWVNSDKHLPYSSCGNGSAVRVSSIPLISYSKEQCLELASRSASITHDSCEGIKGAVCIADIIYTILNTKYVDKLSISCIASEYYRNKEFNPTKIDLDKLRETYEYNETCQGTVPEAIMCFLVSTDFIDAIRNAISIGGDSDTLAAITGSIAAAYYGVPNDVESEVYTILDDYLCKVYRGCNYYTMINYKITGRDDKLNKVFGDSI